MIFLPFPASALPSSGAYCVQRGWNRTQDFYTELAGPPACAITITLMPLTDTLFHQTPRGHLLQNKASSTALTHREPAHAWLMVHISKLVCLPHQTGSLSQHKHPPTDPKLSSTRNPTSDLHMPEDFPVTGKPIALPNKQHMYSPAISSPSRSHSRHS